LFLEISQPIHTLEAHFDGSFAKKGPIIKLWSEQKRADFLKNQ